MVGPVNCDLGINVQYIDSAKLVFSIHLIDFASGRLILANSLICC